MTTRIICNECDWTGDETELLEGPSPFLEGDVLRACPRCIAIDQFAPACEHEGCEHRATVGTPTAEGYAQTCFAHRPT